jgi:hypothetical protein
MTLETEIRHVTKPGADLFLELGFSAAEAKKLHAASRKEINDTRLLKQQLVVELLTGSPRISSVRVTRRKS